MVLQHVQCLVIFQEALLVKHFSTDITLPLVLTRLAFGVIFMNVCLPTNLCRKVPVTLVTLIFFFHVESSMSLEAPCVSEDLATFFAIFKDHIANYRLTYIVGSEEVIVQFS